MVTKRFYAQLAIYLAFLFTLLIHAYRWLENEVFYIVTGVLCGISVVLYFLLKRKGSGLKFYLMLISGILFPFSAMLIPLTEGLNYSITVVFSLLLFLINLFLEERHPKYRMENEILLIIGVVGFVILSFIGIILGFLSSPITVISIVSHIIYMIVILFLGGITLWYFIVSLLKERKKDSKA